MKVGRYCVAWDATPIGIVVDSRHLTKRGAERRYRREVPGSYKDRAFLTTVDLARTLDQLVMEASGRGEIYNSLRELFAAEDPEGVALGMLDGWME